MKKIVGIILGIFISGTSFAAPQISLGVPTQPISVGEVFESQVIVEYSDKDILGDIYMDGLDNFILTKELRSDSQGFTASGAVNIITLSLELVGKQSGEYTLGPVLLDINNTQISTEAKQVTLNENTAASNAQYTPIQSIYFQNKAIKVSTLKALTVLSTIIGAVIFLVMFWVYRKNLEMRKFGYIQVLYSLDAQADSKKAPKKFYTDIYNLFKSYLQSEKKAGFGGKNIKDMKSKLSKKEFDILDLVYNVEYNRSKDSPKYRKKILKELHKYFDKNIV